MIHKKIHKHRHIQINWQDCIKVIAIITMIIDHVGLFILPQYHTLRLIGRIAMPLFCFTAGYNIKNSNIIPNPRLNQTNGFESEAAQTYMKYVRKAESRKICLDHLKMGLGINHKIFAYGVILYVSFLILMDWHYINILIPMYLGYWYIALLKNTINSFYTGYLHILLMCVIWPFTCYLIIDYGSIAIAIMILGYMSAQNLCSIKFGTFISLCLSFGHTFVIFNPSYTYIIFELMLLLVTYYTINLYKFDKAMMGMMGLNILWLSRNTLFIYWFNLFVILLIYRFCL